MFASHHGFVHIHSLPSPSTLVAPSDRFSTLRGLASSANSFGGSGENNLAFKCTRKRLIFETLHLDLEGGVSERRTTAPSSTTVELTTGKGASIEKRTVDHVAPGGGTRIDIEIEGVDQAKKEEGVSDATSKVNLQKPKKKKVAFFSDRPDVYDF
ncbi:hypothetical protein EST38_g7621 [Candolleomyces aberdarensis]|uniref:Uncharacterized protein n=1 Tax=Candolleomyces aberdarensis TaxID=2316362 RepID=A0A4Q2DGM6_9AGAR|nr:hypothetical protein EST38_g7621 [Candolleomyces aberdarensis]